MHNSIKALLSKHGLLVAIVVLALLGFSSHFIFRDLRIKGNGDVITRHYSFPNRSFNAIEIKGKGDLQVLVTNKPSKALVGLTIDSNLLPHINIYIKNKVLFISQQEGVKLTFWKKNEVVIHTAELQLLVIEGLYNSSVNNIQDNAFTAKLIGRNDITMSGKTKLFSVDILGRAQVNTNLLQAEEVVVVSEGSSDLVVRANKKLSINIEGAGTVKYFGKPEQVEQSVEGSGSVVMGQERNI